MRSRESFPDVLVEFDSPVERAARSGGIEPCPEHGRVAKNRAVGRREAIDVCGDDRLDGVGQ